MGLNTYDITKQCRRVTQEELKEMYELSQVRVSFDLSQPSALALQNHDPS